MTLGVASRTRERVGAKVTAALRANSLHLKNPFSGTGLIEATNEKAYDLTSLLHLIAVAVKTLSTRRTRATNPDAHAAPATAPRKTAAHTASGLCDVALAYASHTSS